MTKQINLKNLSQFIIIFLFGVYSALLYFEGKLVFYIHPRYIWLSIAAAIIAIVVGLIGIIRSLRVHKDSHSHETRKSWIKEFSIQDFIIFVIIICGLLIQPKQLSSATAIQRSTDTNTQSSTIKAPTENQLFFNFDYTTLDILDWTNLMRTNPNPDSYKDKPAHISGFVYQDVRHTDNYFFIARFVITCCAVDATPVKILVKGQLPIDIKANDWVDIQGHFDSDTINEEKVNILIPEHIAKIEQPKNPYVY